MASESSTAATAPATEVVTRFAPSPTGFLHIGGARTALFNWLYARHHGGRTLLRIEDTDRKRSTQDAIDAIIEGLDWLGLDYDAPPIFQSDRAERHAEVAWQLLNAGHAYKCFATTEELEAMREEQRANKTPMRYDGRWRDRDPAEAPEGAPFTIRLKAPKDGETTIHDQVQGAVTVKNEEIDDYIILRADGTPTYMLAVVVDDHDMGVTHVIRGDDHLNNAFRQLVIIKAMIPMGKLTKKIQRHEVLSTIAPPISGPSTLLIVKTLVMNPTYLPRSRGGTMSPIMANESENNPPPPIP